MRPGPPRRRSPALVLELAALAVVLAALASCVLFRVTGGHWERVESPSMGTAAPVGTLLWVRPATVEELRVGDVVTFHRPGVVDGPVYSHRVRALLEDGTFETRGDLSGDDKWRVDEQDLVGRVVWAWPGAGRLVEATPVLLAGGLLTAIVVALVRRSGKLPLAVVGAALTLTAAMVVHQPLTAVEQLGPAAPASAGAVPSVRLVSTGLLPVRLASAVGGDVELGPGQAGVVAPVVEAGRLQLDLRPAVPPWVWVLIVVACLAPAVVSAWRPGPPPPPRRPSPARRPHRRLPGRAGHARPLSRV
ncbi:S26 family signal peptidase [Nocardioides flavescens]|uniref:Signal peptidase I n=1 Tax=Nocardioides flavescens TaxID=2691959 RepID=A0A6L7F1G0_9ACTN|nr:S26 family signal peptidase [Nocardioides flavescens]MXG90671.1 hypothetical protein [Nocardioides flavescens]